MIAKRIANVFCLAGLPALLLALVAGWFDPGAAGQVEQADKDVAQVHVTYVEAVARGRVYVELNDGSTYRFRNAARCRVHLSPRLCREVYRGW